MIVGVIDYGLGNIASVAHAIERLGFSPVMIKSALDLNLANVLILPGVGNFKHSMLLLEKGNWRQAIQDHVLGLNKPILGICLGMQLLATSGHEGSEDVLNDGLGLIDGQVLSLRSLGCRQRIPHIGWNNVNHVKSSGLNMFRGIPNGTDFYFVHSFAFVTDNTEHTVAKVEHQINSAAAVQFGSIWGVQFHPEKSQQAGLKLLNNFLEYATC